MLGFPAPRPSLADRALPPALVLVLESRALWQDCRGIEPLEAGDARLVNRQEFLHGGKPVNRRLVQLEIPLVDVEREGDGVDAVVVLIIGAADDRVGVVLVGVDPPASAGFADKFAGDRDRLRDRVVVGCEFFVGVHFLGCP